MSRHAFGSKPSPGHDTTPATLESGARAQDLHGDGRSRNGSGDGWSRDGEGEGERAERVAR